MSTAVQKAIQKGLAALRSPNLAIQKLCTYKAGANPVYDASTGTIQKPIDPIAEVPVVFYEYKKEEIDAQAVRPNDQRAIISQLDLSVIPTLNDTLVAPDGLAWKVIRVEGDPAGAIWDLQVRRP